MAKKINNKEEYEISAENIYILCCLALFLFLIGVGLLNNLSEEECGITLYTSKNITVSRIGTVYDFSIKENKNDKNEVNYIFINYLLLEKSDNIENSSNIINDYCFLTVYNGSIYKEGLDSLLNINLTVITNYEYKKNECFLDPQAISCKSELLSTIIAVMCFTLVGLGIVFNCLVFLRKLIVK